MSQTPNRSVMLREEVGKQKLEFEKSLPAHIQSDKFVRTAQTAIMHTRGIENVTNRASLLIACSKAASDGLILDGREAALVVNGRGEVEYRPMMRGLLKLAHQSGAIKGIVIENVCANDFFEHEPTNPGKPVTHRIEHRQPRGAEFAYYAIAELVGGGIVHEVMNVDDINKIRDRSDAWRAFKAGKIKSTPWHTDYGEMARKTVFRRISKYLPSSSDRERDAVHDAAGRIDDDYSFAVENEPQGATAQAAPHKKRGGASAVLQAITAPEADAPEEIIDSITGEIAGPAADDDHINTDIAPGDDF